MIWPCPHLVLSTTLYPTMEPQGFALLLTLLFFFKNFTSQFIHIGSFFHFKTLCFLFIQFAPFYLVLQSSIDVVFILFSFSFLFIFISNLKTLIKVKPTVNLKVK